MLILLTPINKLTFSNSLSHRACFACLVHLVCLVPLTSGNTKSDFRFHDGSFPTISGMQANADVKDKFIWSVWCLVLTAYCLLRTAYCVVLTAYCLLRSAYCVLLTAYCLLRTAYCVVLTAYCLLRSAYCFLHTAYCFPPFPLSLFPLEKYPSLWMIITTTMPKARRIRAASLLRENV